MIFSLYDLMQPALILPLPTGITYQQQTAGVCCNQRDAEGALIPIPEGFLTRALTQFAERGTYLTSFEADAIDESWGEINTESLQLQIDRQNAADSEEAWVYVTVSMPPYSGPAVLTWQNSD